MAKCSFANHSITGRSPGPFRTGPWKIVLHTTEGASAEGAFGAYRSKGVWPHFTVDAHNIYQHIDTGVSASAVLNKLGGVETNRSHAVQIEMVGFAGQAKDPAALKNVALLGRWIEDVHGVPSTWPAGRPQGNAGPHNRSETLWITQSGWYGHSQVPENSHWDPGHLSDHEFDILMGEHKGGPLKVNGTDQSAVFKRGEDWEVIKGRTWVAWDKWAQFAGYNKAEYDAHTDSPNLLTSKPEKEV